MIHLRLTFLDAVLPFPKMTWRMPQENRHKKQDMGILH